MKAELILFCTILPEDKLAALRKRLVDGLRRLTMIVRQGDPSMHQMRRLVSPSPILLVSTEMNCRYSEVLPAAALHLGFLLDGHHSKILC